MIDRNEIARIASLARLQLDAQEADRLAADCGAILEYFVGLRDIDVGDAEPGDASQRPTPTREDRPDGDPLALTPEEMAPVWREGYYALPRLPAMDGDVEPDI